MADAGSNVLVAGRVAVITGSASGIGFAVARECGARGMRVAISDVNPRALEEAKSTLVRELGEEFVLAVPCDVSSEDDMQRLKEAVYGRYGEVAFLHLNAGVAGGASALTTGQKEWERNIAVNLYGVTNGLRTFVPAMQKQGTACAVAATSSWAGLFNATTFSGLPYVVSKTGAVLVMEALHYELRRIEGCQITAHVLCPGRVDTNMLAGFDEHRRPWYDAQLKRTSDPQERARKEAAFEKATRSSTENSMSPSEMAAVLLEAVQANRFYVLGYDGQQPLAFLKTLTRLRFEDIIHERPPLSHRTEAGKEQRRLLQEAMARGKLGSRL